MASEAKWGFGAHAGAPEASVRHHNSESKGCQREELLRESTKMRDRALQVDRGSRPGVDRQIGAAAAVPVLDALIQVEICNMVCWAVLPRLQRVAAGGILAAVATHAPLIAVVGEPD